MDESELGGDGPVDGALTHKVYQRRTGHAGRLGADASGPIARRRVRFNEGATARERSALLTPAQPARPPGRKPLRCARIGWIRSQPQRLAKFQVARTAKNSKTSSQANEGQIELDVHSFAAAHLP